MKKTIYLLSILSLVIAQSLQYNSPYLTDDIRNSVKSLLKYDDVASTIEDDQSRLEFYQAVSEALHIEIVKFKEMSNEKFQKYEDIITKYKTQLDNEVEKFVLTPKPKFRYEYKPIKISMKSVEKQLHRKQAKTLRKQYLQFYKYYKSNKEIYVTQIDKLKELVKDTEQKVIKEEVVLEDDTSTKEPEVKVQNANLRFGKLNPKTSSIEILYSSTSDIKGFQFDFTGLVIKECNNEVFTISLSSERIIGFSMTNQALPAGEGKLAEILYLSDKETQFCISNLKLAGSHGTEILTEYEKCIEVPTKIEVEVVESTKPTKEIEESVNEEIIEEVVEDSKPIVVEKVELDQIADVKKPEESKIQEKPKPTLQPITEEDEQAVDVKQTNKVPEIVKEIPKIKQKVLEP